MACAASAWRWTIQGLARHLPRAYGNDRQTLRPRKGQAGGDSMVQDATSDHSYADHPANAAHLDDENSNVVELHRVRWKRCLANATQQFIDSFSFDF